MTSWRDRERLVRLVRLVWLMRFRITRMTGVSWTDPVSITEPHIRAVGGEAGVHGVDRPPAPALQGAPAGCRCLACGNGCVALVRRCQSPSKGWSWSRSTKWVKAGPGAHSRTGLYQRYRGWTTASGRLDGPGCRGLRRMARVPPTTPFTIESKSTTPSV